MKTILGGISESLAGRVAETRLATQNIQLLTFLYHCEEKKKHVLRDYRLGLPWNIISSSFHPHDWSQPVIAQPGWRA